MFPLKQFEDLGKKKKSTQNPKPPPKIKAKLNVQKIVTFIPKGKISPALLIFHSLTFPFP